MSTILNPGGAIFNDVHGHKLTWVPDMPDYRDHKFKGTLKSLPDHVDLRPYASPIQDQGELGSCTAQAFASMIELKDRQKRHVDVSRLFIYYNERAYINEIHNDSGAYIRDGIKTLAEHGWALESKWKYDISKFAKKPSGSVYKDALKRRIKEYMRVEGLEQMKQALAMHLPFVFGFTVYENLWEVGSDGIVKMPKGKMLGGHAVLAVGYEDKYQHMIVQNSWGEAWGNKGYGFFPYDYLSNTDLSTDMWTVKS